MTRSKVQMSKSLREASESVQAEIEADPHYQRLAAAGKLEDPEDVLRAQFGAIMDKFVAQAIRNERSGEGKGLRVNGMIETAELLGL